MPHRLTLADMRRQIRAGKLSPTELVDAHFAQIRKHNPKINAFVIQTEEEARKSAKWVEEHDLDQPLRGIPVTIKDSIDVAGYETLTGSKFHLGRRAAHDSTVALRLKRDGAIILGKTNCPEFLMNYETDNNIIGRTNNPWNLELTPGGSSGGESAAIASFMSAGGIGSDAGGSVRVPAHCTGIAALKPTPGRISGAGHQPPVGNPGGLLGVVGPMARTAEDLTLMFEVLAGYDIEDPFSVPLPVQYRPDVKHVRVGIMEQFYDVPVQPVMRKAVQDAASALRELKIRHKPFRPHGLERAPNLWWFFFGEVNSAFIRKIVDTNPEQAHWTGTEFAYQVPDDRNITALEMVEKLMARDAMRASLLRQMQQECEVIIAPACGVPAWKHRQRRWQTPDKEIGLFEAMMLSTFVNVMGLPSVVIPFGMTDGIPVGIQVIGRPFEEEIILELAERLEDVRGRFPAPSLD